MKVATLEKFHLRGGNQDRGDPGVGKVRGGGRIFFPSSRGGTDPGWHYDSPVWTLEERRVSARYYFWIKCYFLCELLAIVSKPYTLFIDNIKYPTFLKYWVHQNKNYSFVLNRGLKFEMVWAFSGFSIPPIYFDFSFDFLDVINLFDHSSFENKASGSFYEAFFKISRNRYLNTSKILTSFKLMYSIL